MNRKTQRDRILRLLSDAQGGWVPLPDILALGIAQYNARIFELRRLGGFNIENRTETDTETGERHSWFRLVFSPCATGKPEPNPDYFEQHHREELQREAPLFVNGVRP